MERIVGAHGMINYVDARTAWMDDIVKQSQWQGITQVGPSAHERLLSEDVSAHALSFGCFEAAQCNSNRRCWEKATDVAA